MPYTNLNIIAIMTTQAQEIAGTILQQLGGGSRVKIMTGAKRFIAADNGLLIGLTRGLYVQISLTALDLYDAHTFKVKRGTLDRVVKNEETGLYNDQIKKWFETSTGLYLSL